VRETWLSLIKEQIHPHKKYRREKTWYLENAVGKTRVVPKKPENLTKQVLREVSAFLLQGLEAAFIYMLITLSEDYGYEVRSCEHDGLITYGTIPEEAKVKAREQSGFSTAFFEEKEFSTSMDTSSQVR